MYTNLEWPCFPGAFILCWRTCFIKLGVGYCPYESYVKTHFRSSRRRLRRWLVWDVASCSLVEVYQRFRGTCSLHHQGDECKHLWNVGKLLPDCTTLQPKRQPSSYTPPWEPQTLLSERRGFTHRNRWNFTCSFLLHTSIFTFIHSGVEDKCWTAL
jgi:hypothetical protein